LFSLQGGSSDCQEQQPKTILGHDYESTSELGYGRQAAAYLSKQMSTAGSNSIYCDDDDDDDGDAYHEYQILPSTFHVFHGKFASGEK
jgi:hypothetical protein